MSETPIAIPYAGESGFTTTQCPVCLKPIEKPHKCKTLYGIPVCSKCRNGLANRRQAAYIVDSVIYTVIFQILLLLVIRTAPASQVGANALEFIVIIASWVVFPFVFTLKDAIGGRSLGKMLFGVRVVDLETREPATPLQSIKRNLILLIPYVGVIGGVITMMKGQRWGDGWARTMVIVNKYAFREPYARSGRYCRGCGYDLTGNVSGQCPECGMAAPTLPIAVAPPPLPADAG